MTITQAAPRPPGAATPSAMTIVYDGHCPFCVRCAEWLLAQRPALRLTVVSRTDPTVHATYGHLPGFGAEMMVIADTGQVWTGPDAFIVAMWCLTSYRHLSLGLSGPTAHHMARSFFRAVSANRGKLGGALGLETCGEGTCHRH